jgi:antitoxin (DNA-binding transcriptional repressor) of toxin-antitoxin stability system
MASPATDQRRWDELHAAYELARAVADAYEIPLSVRYGGASDSSWRSWITKTERDKLDRLRAKVDRIGDKIVELLVRISPRGEAWLSGVPVWWLRERLTWEDAVRPAGEPLSVEVPMAWGATQRLTESGQACTCAAEPRRHAVHAPQRQAKSRLDLILDRVKAGEREVTIDTEGYTRDQVDRIIAAAKARGLSASFDGRVVLIRDLRTMQESTRAPGLQVAVKAMRIYLGSVDYASVRTQQRLYDKASQAVQCVATGTGMSVEDAWGQVESEARRQGAIRPVPGQHF